jgi:hypothetical protein
MYLGVRVSVTYNGPRVWLESVGGASRPDNLESLLHSFAGTAMAQFLPDRKLSKMNAMVQKTIWAMFVPFTIKD